MHAEQDSSSPAACNALSCPVLSCPALSCPALPRTHFGCSPGVGNQIGTPWNHLTSPPPRLGAQSRSVCSTGRALNYIKVGSGRVGSGPTNQPINHDALLIDCPAMTTSYSAIPFKFDFDLLESLEKIEFKHTSPANGVSETVKVKLSLITAGASLLQVLFTINELSHAKNTTLSLTLTQGPMLYEKYVTVRNNQTVATSFAITINAFINYKFNNNGDAYRGHKKFASMVVFHSHTIILPLLPGRPAENPSINNDNFKSLIFESIRTEWEDSNEEHQSPYEDTLRQIVRRMERYQNKVNKNSKQNSHQDNSSQNRKNNNNNNINNSNNNSNNNHNNNN
eukprot:jgi/Psemu1/35091/gm1.35091_g